MTTTNGDKMTTTRRQNDDKRRRTTHGVCVYCQSGLFPGARAAIRRAAVKAHFREYFAQYCEAGEDAPRVREILDGAVEVPFAALLELTIARGKGEHAAGAPGRQPNDDPSERLAGTSASLAAIAAAQGANDAAVTDVMRALGGLERDMSTLRRVIMATASGGGGGGGGGGSGSGGRRASPARGGGGRGKLIVSEVIREKSAQSCGHHRTNRHA